MNLTRLRMIAFIFFTGFFFMSGLAFGRYSPLIDKATTSVVLIFSKHQASIVKQATAGAGVVLDASGYIITCAHVVGSEKHVHVQLKSGRLLPGTVVAVDEDLDLALIKVKSAKLVPMALAAEDKLQVGEAVYAIGNPYGLGYTVSKGIVSALNRSKLALNQYEPFIQFDAAISPGNSGGALINTHGQLVGIVAAVLTHNATKSMGYAIPLYVVNNVFDQLKSQKQIVRGQLGIEVQTMRFQLAKEYSLPYYSGVLVMKVNRPVLLKQLKKFDIITAINGAPVTSLRSFISSIQTRKPGSRVVLTVVRAEKRIKVAVQLDSFSYIKKMNWDSSVWGEGVNRSDDFRPDRR